jgi:hypothetical protein
MIIIKTKNGDHFINEKNITEVVHNKEKETASYYGSNGAFNNIEDVECVTFVSDTQALMYEDKGSRIKELEKVLHEAWKRCDAYRKKLYELGELGNV